MTNLGIDATYLATEMLLYLLAAAVIGLVLGWFVWGMAGRRKIGELTSTLARERREHLALKGDLEEADARLKTSVEAAKSEAEAAISELQEKADAERQAAQEAYAALERMRTELDEAIRSGQASRNEALQQARQAAETERVKAARAVAGEAKAHAELEELRLRIGAEKLAAENARSELDETRRDMQAALDVERAAHHQAKSALDDIRSTLARTLGPAAAELADMDAAGTAAGNAAGGATTPARPETLSDDRPARAGKSFGPSSGIFESAIDIAAAGEALNNPDLDEADIEDREDTNLEFVATIDPEPSAREPAEMLDAEPPLRPDRIELRALPEEPGHGRRPDFLHGQRPDRVDDLKAIDGVGADVETRLNDAGCHHYGQLAAMNGAHVGWLSDAIGVPADRILAERWVEQARALEAGKDAGESDEAQAAG